MRRELVIVRRRALIRPGTRMWETVGFCKNIGPPFREFSHISNFGDVRKTKSSSPLEPPARARAKKIDRFEIRIID